MFISKKTIWASAITLSMVLTAVFAPVTTAAASHKILADSSDFEVLGSGMDRGSTGLSVLGSR